MPTYYFLKIDEFHIGENTPLQETLSIIFYVFWLANSFVDHL